jgi:hypothetical protein
MPFADCGIFDYREEFMAEREIETKIRLLCARVVAAQSESFGKAMRELMREVRGHLRNQSEQQKDRAS